MPAFEHTDRRQTNELSTIFQLQERVTRGHYKRITEITDTNKIV